MTNPYAPPGAIVDDIAEFDAGTVPAERQTRLGAAILDGVIFGIAVYLPLFFVILGDVTPADSDDGAVRRSVLIPSVLTLVGFVTWAGFTLTFMSRNGQSIAKKWLDIKVVRSDGTRASLGRLFWLRNVVITVLSMIPFLGFAVGIIDALFIFGETRQCLHDRIADTIVIKA